MPAFDDRLKRDLERMAEPADPTGAFEQVMERKIRRRILRRAEVVGLVVVVLAGTIGGTFALSRVFRGSGAITPGGSPSTTPGATTSSPTATSPSPTPTPTPTPSPTGSCETSQTIVQGDFDGNGGLDTATVTPRECVIVYPGYGQGRGPQTDYVLQVEWGPSGGGVIAPLAECQSACGAMAAADLNNDGIDELILLVDMGASTQFVEALELKVGEAVGDPSTVVPPGAPGYVAGEPAKFALGGSVTHLDFMTCQTTEGSTRQVIASSAELSNDQTVYNVRETIFTFEPIEAPPLGSFNVVSTRDYSVPFDPSGQTQLSPPGDACWAAG